MRPKRRLPRPPTREADERQRIRMPRVRQGTTEDGAGPGADTAGQRAAGGIATWGTGTYLSAGAEFLRSVRIGADYGDGGAGSVVPALPVFLFVFGHAAEARGRDQRADGAGTEIEREE